LGNPSEARSFLRKVAVSSSVSSRYESSPKIMIWGNMGIPNWCASSKGIPDVVSVTIFTMIASFVSASEAPGVDVRRGTSQTRL
jgi:hypothetical protein